MNRRSSGSLSLSKAVVGFVNHKLAEGLTTRSVYSYERILKKWIKHKGDQEVNMVTTQDIRSYLAWLRTEYKPVRFNRETHPLSPKTIRNVWATLASFFKWASQEFNILNPVADVPAPKFKKAPVDAFTKTEIEHLLKACKFTKSADTKVRRSYSYPRPTARRDRAIILALLDTGLRSRELCSLKIDDVDLRSGRVNVKHGSQGGAKGGKGRSVYLGKTARRAVWRYLAYRDDGEDPRAPLFVTKNDRPMTQSGLRHLIKRLAKKAGVEHAFPHKFRHTFAITYLRSGGDIFTLQAILGHSSLDMVRHYARIAEVDIEKAHRRSSPADNWRL